MASDRGAAPDLDRARARRRRGSIATCCTSPATRCSASRSPPPRVEAARLARAPRRARLASTSRRGRSSTTRSAHASRALAPDLVFANERERDALGELDTRWVREARRGRSSASTASTTPRSPTRRRRHDRRRRRARRGLPDRRRRARARGGGALLRAAGSDAVIRVADEVPTRCGDGRGVVALETTLVAHGFPPGEGVEVGLASERAVREGGAVPATIGVLDGEIVVGLTRGRARALRRHRARKLGPRDLAAAVVQRATRRDDGRRHARRLQSRGHPLHGDGRPRRRASRLAHAARRLGRPAGARAAHRSSSSRRA